MAPRSNALTRKITSSNATQPREKLGTKPSVPRRVSSAYRSGRPASHSTPAHETILRRRAQQRRDRIAAGDEILKSYRDVLPTDYEAIRRAPPRKREKHRGSA